MSTSNIQDSQLPQNQQDKSICFFHKEKCKDKVEITYYSIPLCNKHWDKLSLLSVKDMKSILGIKE